MLRRLGRALEPLLAPDANVRRARDERMLALAQEQRAALSELSTQSAVLLKRTEAIRGADMAGINLRLAKLRGGVRRHSTALGRLADRVGADADLNAAEQRVLERIERIARSDGPVIIGPWTGEIGFELLYWIPFVRWAVRKFGIAPERILVVSRGGTRSWYEGIGDRYLDVFSLVTPDEFRVGTEVVTKKQRFVGAFDRQLLRRVRRETEGAASTLHPALMYALFTPIWKGQAPISRVLEHGRYQKIDGRVAAMLPTLPSEYVAVRFYFSACFPDTADNRAFVASTVASLAAQIDVVMLNPGLRVDDHVDYAGASHDRIHYLDGTMAPEENLAVQTAIIAGARAFIGTYGGFAYLAPFCGVDAIAFHSERNFFLHHLELADQVFTDVGGGHFQAIDLHQRAWLRALFREPQADAADRRA